MIKKIKEIFKEIEISYYFYQFKKIERECLLPSKNSILGKKSKYLKKIKLYFPNEYEKLIEDSVEASSSMFKYILNPPVKMQKYILDVSAGYYISLENISVEMQKEYLNKNPFCIIHFKNPTKEIQLHALKRDLETYTFINKKSIEAVKYVFKINQSYILAFNADYEYFNEIMKFYEKNFTKIENPIIAQQLYDYSKKDKIRIYLAIKFGLGF